MSEQPPVPQASADDETVDIHPRPAALVARRATLIAALLRRAGLEVGVVGTDDPLAERFDLAGWTVAEGLPALATEAEAETFIAPIGGLDPLLVDEATWDAEALIALAWSLGLIEAMPPYSEIANPLAALNALPVPWDSIAQFARSVKLRPVEELARERERAEVWRWRALTEMARRAAPAAKRPELEAGLGEFAREAATAGYIAQMKDGDFPVGARPYRRLSDDELDDLAEVARQRLHALNWCCGFGASWQDEEALDVPWPDEA